MLLNRDDIEYMWNELAIYLHFIIITLLLFTALYAWHIKPLITFVIMSADFILLISLVNGILRRNRMREMCSPYADKKFVKGIARFLYNEAHIDEDSIEPITKRIHNTIEEAYKRGYYDGKRS